MSTYAHNVSLFLRDSSSFVTFAHIFTIYSELSGAPINMGKSQVLCLCEFLIDLVCRVEWIAAVKVLDVRETWRGIFNKAEKRLEVAARFEMPFPELAMSSKHVSRQCFSTWPGLRVCRTLPRKIEKLLFSFF